jgi:DNA-binding MarR family transcriptional regulator
MTQHELDRIVASVAQGPGHERLYRDLIRRSGVAISAAESWVLWYVAARGPISLAALAARLELDPTGLGGLFGALGRRGYVQPDPQGLPDLTSNGRHALVALVKAGQEVARLIRGREPGDEGERTRVVRRLTHAALMTMPGLSLTIPDSSGTTTCRGSARGHRGDGRPRDGEDGQFDQRHHRADAVADPR